MNVQDNDCTNTHESVNVNRHTNNLCGYRKRNKVPEQLTTKTQSQATQRFHAPNTEMRSFTITDDKRSFRALTSRQIELCELRYESGHLLVIRNPEWRRLLRAHAVRNPVESVANNNRHVAGLGYIVNKEFWEAASNWRWQILPYAMIEEILCQAESSDDALILIRKFHTPIQTKM